MIYNDLFYYFDKKLDFTLQLSDHSFEIFSFFYDLLKFKIGVNIKNVFSLKFNNGSYKSLCKSERDIKER